MTVALSLVSVLVAVVLGALGLAARLSASRLARTLGTAHVTVIRAVPDLVVMLILFYGGQMLVSRVVEATGLIERFEIPRFAAGAAALGIIFGSYMAESLRGAHLGIPKGQVEAARALGLRPR